MAAGTGATSTANAASAPADFAGLGDWAFPNAQTVQSEGGQGLKNWRVGFVWDWVEHTQGKQYWGGYDGLLKNASAQGISLTFAINGCVQWVCGQTRVQPQTPEQQAAFQAFIATAVKRYGAGGSFWAANPTVKPVPIAWQVWNEVNVGADWSHPTAPAYQAFLKSTNATIKGIDPSATVVTSGLAEFPASSDGATLASFLTALEQDPAFRTSADVVAVHGYAESPAGLVRILDTARGIMRAAGDTRPLWVTELGWANAGPSHPFVSNDATQADYLRQAYDTMVACRSRWNLQKAMWFSLQDAKPAALGEADYWGMHTGLYGSDGVAKPALAAFNEFLGSRELPAGRGASCPLDGGSDQSATDKATASLPGNGPAPTVTVTRAPTLIGAATRAPRIDFVTNMGNAGNAQCSVNGSDWTLCATPYFIPKDREGTFTLQVRGVSPTGVIGAPVSASWTVDLTAPTTVFRKAPPKRVRAASTVRATFGVQGARLAAGSSEAVTFQCKINRGGWLPCAAKYRARRLAIGRQTLRVRAVDAAGNVDPRGAKARYTVTRR